MAVKPRTPPNLPVNYEAQLEKEAAEIAKRIAAPSGDRIRFNSNRGFITPDGIEGSELEVVIVDFISANVYYEGDFDRGNPQPPGCFALGPEPAVLVPSSNSPAKQAPTCAGCPNNQFGSSGKGKACKNTRLVALMPASAVDDPDNAPLWIMAVPPTSMKAFDSYVHGLSVKQRKSPVGVVTSITMDTSVTYAAPRFAAVRLVEPEQLGVFMSRRDEANQRLYIEPDVSQYVPASTKTGRGASPARKIR